ncbi:MAG: SH3 domain-containing protein [Novosphingobium sp.]|nr:SH3 domain-containing protein [Novosphingobium sp.]
MKIADPRHTPVRGDLAHIRLAGRYFVPHYAAPMERRIGAGGAALLVAGRDGAEALATLAPGSRFAVLDLAGGWAWGQVTGSAAGDDGFVGYVAVDRLDGEA